MSFLLDLARRYADEHADADGVAQTGLPGVSVIRARQPSDLQFAVSRPLVALLLQGRKTVTMGTRAFTFGAGESLLATADVPTVSQIVEASAAKPYCSFVLELDLALVTEIVAEMRAGESADTAPLRVDKTEDEVADAALRLMRILDRPAALAVLKDQLLREIHYWLLAGRHGAAIRHLGGADGHAGRIARAVAILRRDFADRVPVTRLAEAARMSISSFHEHFRAVTSLSPLQFQKHLRLIEARRLMLSEDMPANAAAYAVGYESPTQFSREYRRMFGLPPARDVRATEALRPGPAAVQLA